MSNKPKIWANCDAGCKWETVHKDDFQSSAAFIRQSVTDNGSFKEYNLEAGKTCILKGDIFGENGLWKVKYEFRDANNNVYGGPSSFTRKPWDTYLTIKNCGVHTDKDNNNVLTLFYEFHGCRNMTGEQKIAVSDKTTYIRLMYVDEVYLVNDAMDKILNAEEESV